MWPCKNDWTVRAAVLNGEWGRPTKSCIRWVRTLSPPGKYGRTIVRGGRVGDAARSQITYGAITVCVCQLHGELDELHRQLNSRRGAYGSSLSTVKLTAQAFKQFERSVDLIDGKVAGFQDTAETMMRDGRCDSRRLRREVCTCGVWNPRYGGG